MSILKIPEAPKSIQKGFPLKLVLDQAATNQLGENFQSVHAPFDKGAFIQDAMKGIEPLSITERSKRVQFILSFFVENNGLKPHCLGRRQWSSGHCATF